MKNRESASQAGRARRKSGASNRPTRRRCGSFWIFLEDIEDPRSIDVIIESGLKDKSENIREAALKSLEWMTEMEFKSYEDATLWWSANRDQLRF